MASQLLSVAALLLGAMLLTLAGGMHGLLLPIVGTMEHFTVTQLGLIGTGWAVGFMTGCLLVPRMVSRVGHTRTYGVMASVAAIAVLLNLMVISPWAWITLRALSGFCGAGAAMIVESWLNERCTRENRGTIFAIYQMVNFGAATAGQLSLAFQAPSQFFFFVVCAILYCLAILPTALSTAQSPRPLKGTQLDLKALFANSPVSAVGCFMIGLVNGAFGTLVAVYAQQIGLPIAAVAVLSSGAVLGGALSQIPLGRLSDRMDRRKVLAGLGFAAMVLGITLFLFQPESRVPVILLITVFGALIYPMYAVSVAHANDMAMAEDFVKIASGLLLLFGFGLMIGPIVAAIAMEQLGPGGLFAFTAVVHFSIAVYAVYRITVRLPLPQALRARFQAMPLPKDATPSTVVLDPRARDDDTAGGLGLPDAADRAA